MQFLSVTAVLLNLVLIHEVAAVEAVEATIAMCQQVPKYCPKQNDCGYFFSDRHASCRAKVWLLPKCGVGANAAICCDQQLYCWSAGGGIGT
ncbi:hypothetical protein EG328_006336 [Venturia inaequalis]|uniref:Uncharacterized protein n=1 Tax=Venturia inaequalis TaxID=5025 RepID=A0A8H3UY87_VENIN|nr:hypothetical protein EG328_006336 [Venturia inaequalis]KAE9978560.1 hypothetical protein EG327_007343 [Venturia inaequalis]